MEGDGESGGDAGGHSAGPPLACPPIKNTRANWRALHPATSTTRISTLAFLLAISTVLRLDN